MRGCSNPYFISHKVAALTYQHMHWITSSTSKDSDKPRNTVPLFHHPVVNLTVYLTLDGSIKPIEIPRCKIIFLTHLMFKYTSYTWRRADIDIIKIRDAYFDDAGNILGISDRCHLHVMIWAADVLPVMQPHDCWQRKSRGQARDLATLSPPSD